MEEKEITLAGKTVKKSNELARARWSPDSVWEARIVALLASKIKPQDKTLKDYEIRISELIDESNHGGNNYKEIEKAVDKAMGRVITLRDGDDWKKYTLFSRCEFNSRNGILKICFHPDLKEHYLGLKQYMRYNLEEFVHLPSTYSQRIFEILKSWDDKNEVTIKLAELHDILCTPKSFRANFAEFKRKVIDKAHKDITKYTSLRYEWEPIKHGRAVDEIRFIFPKKRKRQITANAKTESFLQDAGVKTQENTRAKYGNEFLDKFTKIARERVKAGRMWFELDKQGIAPLAEDVPVDNELSAVEFLEQWKKARASRKSNSGKK